MTKSTDATEGLTRALRYDVGKPTFHHIYPLVLARIFDSPNLVYEPMIRWYYYGESVPQTLDYSVFPVLDYGARKYASLNYALGMKYSRVFDSWFRHAYYYPQVCGETTDLESGEPHAAHAACNELFALTYEVLGFNGGELDNRPKGLK